jgi:hypothetical protein
MNFMKQMHFRFLSCLLLLMVSVSCNEAESDCGNQMEDQYDAYNSFFSNPADIYWGVTSGIRSYSYNYTFGNICTKQNPKVSFTLSLSQSNEGSANPLSVTAGVYTCLAVQAHHVTMTPDQDQIFYRGGPDEIGMQQCFGSLNSATIYPYMTVSFNTLGSSHDDSIHLVDHVLMMRAYIEYYVPK